MIAATNQNLEEAIREKRFREDLFFRLNVIPIEAPPLRAAHRKTFRLLAQSTSSRNSANQPPTRLTLEGFAQEALDLLCNHPWPGNVRELENLVERLVVTHELGATKKSASGRPAAPSSTRRPSVTAFLHRRVPARPAFPSAKWSTTSKPT